jgi:ADP-ribose pyrophosphatase YjhB (NUDIX family)
VTISPYLAGLRARIGNDLLVLPGVAVIVRDSGGRLLLVRDRDSGAWGLPAGAIEPSESPSDAAHRELREETGIDCQPLELIAGLGGDEFRHTYPNGDMVEYAIFVYGGTAAEDSVARPQDDQEVAEARFFERDAAPALSLPYPEDILWGRSVTDS